MMAEAGRASRPDDAGARALRGRRADWAGRQAEAGVAARYERCGAQVVARRWRGAGGEIDLVLRMAGTVVFVEVKQARDHARAAESLRPQQVRRLIAAAEEYVGDAPAGSLTEVRFDVALVDDRGAVSVIENAFAA
jgi:putative endonuclease